MASGIPCQENRWYIFPIFSATVELFGILSVIFYRLIYKFYIRCQNRKMLRQSQVICNSNSSSKVKDTVTVTFTTTETAVEDKAVDQTNAVINNNFRSDSVFINNDDCEPQQINWMIEAKDWAGEIISGQTKTGKLLISLVSVLSLGSLIIYFVEVTRMEGSIVEMCIDWSTNYTQQIDLAFNIIFLVFFGLRWIAANDKLWFWFEIYSLVDVFTVPPAFMTFILDRYWVGFRFIRALRLMSLTDVLMFLNIMRSSNKIRLCHLVTLFASLVMTAAGFIHLIELSSETAFGIPNQNRTYFDYTYFMIVTMSTVGYGDIVCKTWLGKLLMAFFILGGLAIFANSIPEMIEIIGSRNRYGGYYKQEAGKQHIILCGHITFESVSNFLSDFLHKDREDVDVQIVILDTFTPNLQLQSVLKRNLNQVLFYQGSVMNSNDLARVQMERADACLVLCDKYSMDPDAEDAANIMRVISVKNYCPIIKIIVQLMQYHNKAYLMNIPSWDWRRGDDVVCIAELKLGFIAQSCLAPGFSTMLSNLFAMRSFEKYSDVPGWVNKYMEGACLEMYTEYLSPSFHGMTFREVVIVCFTKLQLLLIAIEVKSGNNYPNKNNNRNGSTSIAINPKPGVKIEPGTQGFFIAESADDAKRAFYYCSQCHYNKDYRVIKACSCNDNKNFQQILYNIQVAAAESEAQSSKNISTFSLKRQTKPEVLLRRKRMKREIEDHDDVNDNISKIYNSIRFNDQQQRRFDATGMFHWCPAQKFEQVLLTSENAEVSSIVFCKHIIVCIFADSSSPLIGLRSFVMPLRSSNYHFNELKPIILVGSQDHIRREWKSIMNFPKIFILNGSPLNRANLRLININLCEMTVILSTNHSSSLIDTYLADKEAILCSLNIKAMRFRDDKLNQEELANLFTSPKYESDTVPLITEISVDASVQYLDQDDDDNPDTELFLTQPFSCGRAFAVSVLDSLMSTAYYNENALTLIRTMITGGATPELEEMLAEGSGFQGAYLTPETVSNRDRCRIEMIQLTKQPYCDIFRNRQNNDNFLKTYNELFLKNFNSFGILCLGLYRLTDLDEKQNVIDGRNNEPNDYLYEKNRYVYTNPAPETELHDSDYVFCLRPFNIDLHKSASATATSTSIATDNQKRVTDNHNPSNTTVKTNNAHHFPLITSSSSSKRVTEV